jgi:hypothetical protein
MAIIPAPRAYKQLTLEEAEARVNAAVKGMSVDESVDVAFFQGELGFTDRMTLEKNVLDAGYKIEPSYVGTPAFTWIIWCGTAPSLEKTNRVIRGDNHQDRKCESFYDK